MLLKDRIALITGSGRGIGRAIAQLFATEGAAVFLTARTEKELSATAEEITQGGGRAAFVTGDLAKEADGRAVFEKAIASFGRVDILVNSGGHYGPVVPVEEYPMEEFDRVLAVHLRAAFLLSKLVLPGMYERRRGVIVNISSISAKAAYSWGSAYAAAKAGLLGLTRYNAAEAARKGVRVNAICPGFIETEMYSNIPDKVKEAILQRIPLKRVGTPQEVARAVRYLIVDGDYITGQTLNINGGFYM